MTLISLLALSTISTSTKNKLIIIMIIGTEKNSSKYIEELCIHFFLISGFSFMNTEHLQNSRDKEGLTFIPLYHFYSLTNIQVTIFTLVPMMTTTHFLIMVHLVYGLLRGAD